MTLSPCDSSHDATCRAAWRPPLATAHSAGMVRRAPLVLVALIGAMLSPLAAHATEYFVATTGSDKNPGTLAAPWATVAYATSRASPVAAGDTIFVRAGSYPEHVALEKGGADGRPI